MWVKEGEHTKSKCCITPFISSRKTGKSNLHCRGKDSGDPRVSCDWEGVGDY